MQALTKRPSASFLFLAYLAAVAVGTFAMVLARAYQSGFSGADEPSHFLNGYFIANYLSTHLGANPMAAAADFYIHYPKISIGHWPPAYYGFLGLLFMVLPPTMPVVFALNVLLAALPAIGIAAALSLLADRRAAIIGVLVYALTPLVLEGHAMFMVDQPLAACLVAATAVWIAYAAAPGWGKAIGFALLAALAVLMKGNGWLVVFIPVFHIALTANWKQLLSIKPYVAAVLMALLVVPWYLLTAKIAADGFNYQAGLPYASQALLANLLTLSHNLTPAGVLLALFAVVAEFRQRARSALRWSIVSCILSLVLATLLLQSLVPVDIVDRYMAPALPAVVVLAILGAQHLLAMLAQRGARPAAALAAAVLAVVMAVPGVMHLAARPPKADTGIGLLSQALAPANRPTLTVIDGPAGAEGAFIAEMAVHDSRLQGYVIRASKLLADSNFMGSSYTLKYSNAGQVLAALNRLGVQHVVIVRQNNNPAYPHSTQMRDALMGRDSGFVLTRRLPHQYRDGVTEVYEASGIVTPDIAAVREMGIPAKASKLTQLQQ
ncbi:glycosyltransferase family 39 protein [Herbaspirillum sp. SJZ107]|uniref:ArnT family glycosyltransferase n=1 Tax=Herbaspirillum sp. SJZ107 TaxID=2572881 RepID=UPI0011545A2E|nr:glycosyltransferase family 39 protein [Herbaspirillum sp. SJZ107]TQK05264.1 dolichyl-phosphate-mannose-protein mannosyltransferase [Herbaspirillum sp. SJZ107]